MNVTEYFCLVTGNTGGSDITSGVVVEYLSDMYMYVYIYKHTHIYICISSTVGALSVQLSKIFSRCINGQWGNMVAQWFALQPHTEKVAGSIPGVWDLSVWSKHACEVKLGTLN